MKGIYDWVHWFRTLSARIAEVREQGLIDRALAVNWGTDDPALLKFGAEKIDPLSFLYFLSSKNGNHAVFESVREIFEITPLPDKEKPEAWVFPTAIGIKALFFGDSGADPELYWRLFLQAQPDKPALRAETLHDALEVPGVGVAMLTQALCLTNAHTFLPVDKFVLALAGVLPEAANFKKKPKADFSLSEYELFMQGARDLFPGCHLYEIARFLYEHGSFTDDDGNTRPLVSEKSKFFQISTNVRGDFDDEWDAFVQENAVWTGGPGSKRQYRLESPKSGDIILVRFRQDCGKGIGVVQRNDFRDHGGFSPDRKIHVFWINKEIAEFDPKASRSAGFSGTTSTDLSVLAVFRNTKNYDPSFGLLDALHVPIPPDPVRPTPDPVPDDASTYPLNQILYGPPGTGKTWRTIAMAVAIAERQDVKSVDAESRESVKARFDTLQENGQIEMVTFHQNYAYEDFVEGIRPVLGRDSAGQVAYHLLPGCFRSIAVDAHKEWDRSKRDGDSCERFVLIIDEINRGNIARIFGELITLLEESRRLGREDSTTVTLPYSGAKFGVPENLYIIGTMNTADRSIALLDTALRRRFEFVEMMPRVDHEGVSTNVDGVDCRRLLESMNRRIRFLHDREHQIGHTYFLGVKNIVELKKAFQKQILPLLQEYFYDNWAKMKAVLGASGFIKTVNRPGELSTELVDADQRAYDVLAYTNEKWEEPASYRKIYDEKAGVTGKAPEAEAEQGTETGGTGGG